MSKSKQKGTAMERRVVEYLRDQGFIYAERRALEGKNDRGDISGIPGVVIEVKNEKSFDLARYIDETEAEKANAGASVGFAVFPRRSHYIGKAYALCTLDQMIELLKQGDL